MTAPWLFHPGIPDVGDVAVLDDREARHATAARRVRPGDTICLFDGLGLLAEAELVEGEGAGRQARARIVSREQVPPPPRRLHVAAALPKGDRQSVMLSMATQLGMATFTPLRCERSVAKWSPAFTARAERIVVEACKQSRRAWAPDIQPPQTPADVVAGHRSRSHEVWLAHPGGERHGDAVAGRAGAGDLVLLVGPEGGFTDDEVAAVRAAGARMVSLGPLILRTETAVVALLACAGLAAQPQTPQ